MQTFARLVLLVPILAAMGTASAQESVPALTIPAFCGYAYPDANAPRRDMLTGAVTQCAGELHYYFECATPGQVRIEITRTGNPEADQIELSVAPYPNGNAAPAKATLPSGETSTWVGTFGLHIPGMHKLILKSADDKPLRNLLAVRLTGAPVRACTVERRNASSVHLGYAAPDEHKDDVEWFYCEVTPKTDPLWTYYMATGWHRGYFGMQVNSETERRVIFSVWDSGNEAVDRKKVKAEDLVQLVKKGDGVYAGGFGNEGTGGHSHLVHDWKLGDTIRFAVQAKPEGTHTTYTGWFSHVHGGEATVTDAWQLVASFNAPRDGKYLHGLYSFSENFSGNNGDRDRQCDFGNIWLRSNGGDWLAVRSARFTHDGHGKLRSDRRAGVRDGRFFLQHGNFATPTMRHGSRLTLPEDTTGKPPQLPQ